MKKNKFLFGKRSVKKTWAPKMWDIVGGHSLKGEHPLDTLKRETLEEINVGVSNARLLATINVPGTNKHESFRYQIYMITAWKGKPINNCDEHTKIRWFTRKQLGKTKIASAHYLKLIDDWLDADSVMQK